MPSLEITTGRHAGNTLELGKAAILGRGDTVELKIADAKASREHCRVFQQAGSWVVVDLNSRNGITVNGVKTTRKNLRDGDTIAIGETVVAFRDRAASAPASRPETEADDLEIDLDLGDDDDDDGPVVRPVVKPVSAPPSRPAAKKAGGQSAKDKAFAQARQAAAKSGSRGGGRGGGAAEKAGINVRDDVLQFNRIDPNKAKLFDIELSQYGIGAQILMWGGGILVVVVVVWLVFKTMGVTAG